MPGPGGPRWARGSRRRSTGGRSCARACRTATTTRRASCGWLGRGEGAPAPAPPRGHDGRRRSDGGERERRWKTSLVFWGAGADSPGWLVRCLDEFARREINLTKIESRPRRERLGHYMFFVDLEGGVETERSVQRRRGRRARDVRGGARARVLSRRRALRSQRARDRTSVDTLAAQWIPPFHLYQSGPCRFPSTGDAGLTVAGCSFSTRRTSRSTCARSGAPSCCC